MATVSNGSAQFFLAPLLRAAESRAFSFVTERHGKTPWANHLGAVAYAVFSFDPLPAPVLIVSREMQIK